MIVYACTAIASSSATSRTLDADRLRTEMQRLLASGICHFVVDLSQYQYTDEPMLGSMVSALKVARESRGKIAIVARGRTRRMLEITGLTQVFSVHDQLADALAALDM